GVSRKSGSRTSLTPGRAVEPAKVVLLDVGTGSACIPISVLKNIPGIKAVATEISGAAMRVARRNIRKHRLKSRIKLIKSDLLENVPAGLFKDREVIAVANLPYIPKQFQVDPSTKYEPDVALYGGEDGLDIYKRLVDQLAEIKPRAIFFELFEEQIAILASRMPGYELKYAKDMTGEARVMMMERNN
ncbi:tRNA (adenine(22)-N(1))-methyltransferase TrmK, partial [Patescibacteria group bacterium]|nr:tRNA (adenine(22)-N(1))-methyltransferase TrmK [Patescibacteria group bacterium]